MASGFELFMPIFQGKLPERVPVLCNLFEQGSDLLELSIPEYYSDHLNIVNGQMKMTSHFKLDTIWSSSYAAADAEALGSRKIIYSKDGPPNVGHLILNSDSDIKNFTIPENLSSVPVIQDEVERILKIKEKTGGKYPVCSFVTASFSLPVMLMGIGRWLSLLLTGDQQIRDHLLSLCSKYVGEKIKILREAGSDFIAYANPIASATFLDASQFEKLAAQWIIQDMTEAGTDNIVYFCGGGRIEPYLDKIAAAAGVSAYYLNPFDDITRARKKLGANGLIIGSINDIKLINLSETEISEEVKRIMAEGKKAGGFLFGTLMMPYKIPFENIHAMIRSAHLYGKYDQK